MKHFVIIVAGGTGQRFGSTTPKQFLLLRGKPILMRTIEAFISYDSSIQVIITLPPDFIQLWQSLCKQYNFTVSHIFVEGGQTRFHSVKNGLNQIKEAGLVAVHDAVRPLVSSAVIERCFQTAKIKGNAVPVIPVVDSIRQLTENGSVPVDRENFMQVQTPQVFDVHLLKNAYNTEYITEFTDDASVVEKFGKEIFLVEGNRENIKITSQTDLSIAEVLGHHLQ
jgi:2-C-methyl-D-erythritol 4-phosphate cytidylyltransferase